MLLSSFYQTTMHTSNDLKVSEIEIQYRNKVKSTDRMKISGSKDAEEYWRCHSLIMSFCYQMTATSPSPTKAVCNSQRRTLNKLLWNLQLQSSWLLSACPWDHGADDSTTGVMYLSHATRRDLASGFSFLLLVCRSWLRALFCCGTDL